MTFNWRSYIDALSAMFNECIARTGRIRGSAGGEAVRFDPEKKFESLRPPIANGACPRFRGCN